MKTLINFFNTLMTLYDVRYFLQNFQFHHCFMHNNAKFYLGKVTLKVCVITFLENLRKFLIQFRTYLTN